MKKQKIAISLDKRLLDLVDSKVDGSVIRSRSQAIELFLHRGIEEKSVENAVILLHKDHQKTSLKKIDGLSLIKKQIEFFSKNGVKNVYILTPHTQDTNMLLNEIMDSGINAEIIEDEGKGNAKALLSVKDKLGNNFVVMSGDTFNDFHLLDMIKKHLKTDRLVTMGLMTRDSPSKYGAAILDGDLIINFEEKSKTTKSHVVNAGIYIFKKELFELFEAAISLERNIFPKLAKIKQLNGFFTHGEYVHLGD